MRKTLLLSLLLVGFLRPYAQETPSQKLQRELTQHPQADTFRVNRLILLMRGGSLSMKQIDSVASVTLATSKTINYPVGQAQAMLAQAYLMMIRGNQPGAMALLQQSEAIAQKTGDQSLIAAVLREQGRANGSFDNKKALSYYLKAVAIAGGLPDKTTLARCQAELSDLYSSSVGDYPKALEWALKAVKTAEQTNNPQLLLTAWGELGALYIALGDHKTSLMYLNRALLSSRQTGDKRSMSNILNVIGENYRLMGNYPQAIKAYNEALALDEKPRQRQIYEANLADVYLRMGNFQLTFKYGFSALKNAEKYNYPQNAAWVDGTLGRAYNKLHLPDSAIFYGQRGLKIASQIPALEFMRDNSGVLADAYAQKKDFEKAYFFENQFITYRDSLHNTEVTNNTNLQQYNYDLDKKQAQIKLLGQKQKLQNTLLTGTVAALVLIGITVVVLLRSNGHKQKANLLLYEQKKTIEEQRDQTNKALNDLRLTQTQLIQSEKMASLGELTAGIAHEIQNPLNFVNNFSEVSIELLDELQEEAKAGNAQDVIEIAADLTQNLQKINHHGKRADSIVKGMLEHSRVGSGTKEPTNVNNLADEYLRLAYHGLRAKDKAFNCELITVFDDSLPKIGVVPQDIGRVMLNLFNNAFYAVKEKAKTAGSDYKSRVEVTTSIENGQVAIKVTDNGTGMPQHVKEKIMQPFFTTKPTGEGTGLGLSLTYDMVVKGHGGSISVDTVEGELTEFVVRLPIG